MLNTVLRLLRPLHNLVQSSRTAGLDSDPQNAGITREADGLIIFTIDEYVGTLDAAIAYADIHPLSVRDWGTLSILPGAQKGALAIAYMWPDEKIAFSMGCEVAIGDAKATLDKLFNEVEIERARLHGGDPHTLTPQNVGRWFYTCLHDVTLAVDASCMTLDDDQLTLDLAVARRALDEVDHDERHGRLLEAGQEWLVDEGSGRLITELQPGMRVLFKDLATGEIKTTYAGYFYEWVQVFTARLTNPHSGVRGSVS